MKKFGINTRDLTKMAVFLALSLVSFLIESLFPPPIPPLPWVRLGVSQVFVLMTLFYVGGWQAVTVLLAKCLLGGVFSGFLSVWYSLSAGLASLLLGLFLYQCCYRVFGLPAVSGACAALHNMVQILMAMVLTGSAGLLWFLPLSALAGLAMGVITGLAAYLALRTLRRFARD